MIVLKILLYAVLAVLGVAVLAIVLALALPTVAEISYIGGKLTYKVRFSFLKLMDSEGDGLIKNLKKKRKKKKKIPEKDDGGEDSEEEEDFPDIEEIPPDYDVSDYEDYEISDEPESEPVTDENEIRAEKIRRIKEKKSRKQKSEKPDIPKKKDGGIAEKIDKLLDIWEIGGRPLLKIFRGFHIDKIFIDFIVADEDAYKCALNYGRVSGAVYNSLAWLGELFTVSYKTVDIRSGFSLKKSQWDASCKVSFRLHTLVWSAVWFLAVYLFKIVIPKKKAKKSEK